MRRRSSGGMTQQGRRRGNDRGEGKCKDTQLSRARLGEGHNEGGGREMMKRQRKRREDEEEEERETTRRMRREKQGQGGKHEDAGQMGGWMTIEQSHLALLFSFI